MKAYLIILIILGLTLFVQAQWWGGGFRYGDDDDDDDDDWGYGRRYNRGFGRSYNRGYGRQRSYGRRSYGGGFFGRFFNNDNDDWD